MVVVVPSGLLLEPFVIALLNLNLSLNLILLLVAGCLLLVACYWLLVASPERA